MHHDQWGTGKGGPILAAKISPGSQTRSVHYDQWGGPILAAKISPGRPILAGPGDHFFAKIGPGDHFWGD